MVFVFKRLGGLFVSSSCVGCVGSVGGLFVPAAVWAVLGVCCECGLCWAVRVGLIPAAVLGEVRLHITLYMPLSGHI